MQILAGLAALALMATVLWDGFETIVLPRRVTRKVRLARLFYATAWRVWRAVGYLFEGRRRETYLSVFGPLSLLLLLGVWAVGLIVAFALLYLSIGSPMKAPSGHGFGVDVYVSGTTFTTLGLGDVTPESPGARFIMVTEATTGFGFLALVIGYLPVIYGAFSGRERTISLLDARAGSPATATELLRRHAQGQGMHSLESLLQEWERWAADLLESHISYPVLSYFRSQHANQSWLAALTAILDTCAVCIVLLDGVARWQAELSFAMCRHAVVDLAQIFNTAPSPPERDRLPAKDLQRLRKILIGAGLAFRETGDPERELADLRAMYEPYAHALAGHFELSLPPWFPRPGSLDNWRTSAWGRIATRQVLPLPEQDDVHQ